ncbi:hypothetical protein NPIL_648131 [Nephila pilipes]|uniref:Uncharacterized protein n=1 Tax=Nephila pilipes TaxID=299642 RepID=A0A8X6T8U0_NEPPI|nr:hypothetical protein NPIL_648131 [Nephila pilipes]
MKTEDRLERPSVSCYGCRKPGVAKPRCPNRKPTGNKDSANLSNFSLHSCSNSKSKCGAEKEGANFQKARLSMSLADSQKSEVDVYTTSVVIRLEGRVIRSPLTVLPYAKGNQTLLGMNFFTKIWHCSEPEIPPLVL